MKRQELEVLRHCKERRYRRITENIVLELLKKHLRFGCASEKEERGDENLDIVRCC